MANGDLFHAAMLDYQAAFIALLVSLGSAHTFQEKAALQPSLLHAHADKQASVSSSFHAEQSYAAGRSLEDTPLKPPAKNNIKYTFPTHMESSSKAALPVELPQPYYYVDDYQQPRQYHAWLHPSSTYNQHWRPPYAQWSYYSQWPHYGGTGMSTAGWGYPSLPYYSWMRSAGSGVEDLTLTDYGPLADVISPAKALPVGHGFSDAKHNNVGHNLPYLRFFKL